VIGPVVGLSEMLAASQLAAPAIIVDEAMPRTAAAQGE
jgi:hypothetical protein